jgi:hypothetical protein
MRKLMAMMMSMGFDFTLEEPESKLTDVPPTLEDLQGDG